jgi:hypothetical protein
MNSLGVSDMKTSELQGAALDWAVAKCEGHIDRLALTAREFLSFREDQGYEPSTDWAQGGPIIERYCINLFRLDPKSEDDNRFWLAHIDGIYCRYGVSALVAAMRCYVASKLGDEIELPAEFFSKKA